MFIFKIWCIFTKWTSPSAAAKKVIHLSSPTTLANKRKWLSLNFLQSHISDAQTKTIDHRMAAKDVFAVENTRDTCELLGNHFQKAPFRCENGKCVENLCMFHSVNASMCAEQVSGRKKFEWFWLCWRYPPQKWLVIVVAVAAATPLHVNYILYLYPVCHPGYCVYIETVHLYALPANFAESEQFFWNLQFACGSRKMQGVLGQSRHKPKPTCLASAGILAEHSENQLGGENCDESRSAHKLPVIFVRLLATAATSHQSN